MNQIDQQVSALSLIEEALKPILYADIFDFPLTFDEIHRFLEFETSPENLKSLLDQAVDSGEIIWQNGYYQLPDRPDLVVRRQERWVAAQTLWPKAVHYGRWIAALPFVRMVAITGSLAVENPQDKIDDIDYLIVTQPGRLWLCRAAIILLVRYGHLRRVHLCPNYLITENILHFEDDNLFIAREMLQMVPLYGRSTYLEMRRRNDWITHYLPQGTGLNLQRLNDKLSLGQTSLKKMGEFILRGFIGDLVEKPLQKFQITKHTRLAEKYGAADKVAFTADQCKGHYNGHNARVMNAYYGRMEKYNRTAMRST